MAKNNAKTNHVSVVKRTSQGNKMKPRNKHKARSFKAYRGQGKP